LEKQLSRLDAAVEALRRVQRNLQRYRDSVLKAACEGKLVPTEAELARREGRGYEPASELLRRILVERRRRWEESQIEKMRAKGKQPKDGKWKAKYKEPAPPKTAGLPELPEGWCWATVEQLAEIVSGQTPSGIVEIAKEHGEVPWFKVGDMNKADGAMMFESSSFVSLREATSLGLHLHEAGTIVFPKRGGAIATNKKRILGLRGGIDLNCMGFRPANSILGYFWFWFAGIDLGSISDGSNVPQINLSDVSPLTVPLPPSREASRIASRCEEVDGHLVRQRSTVARALKRADRLRQSLLRDAFFGRLVPQDPNDEPASALIARIRAEREAAAGEKKTSPPSRRGRRVGNPEVAEW
jgi:type I restriction enzyme S subunit